MLRQKWKPGELKESTATLQMCFLVVVLRHLQTVSVSKQQLFAIVGKIQREYWYKRRGILDIVDEGILKLMLVLEKAKAHRKGVEGFASAPSFCICGDC